MDRYPQCYSCKYNKERKVCTKDKKPIETYSMIFGRCMDYKHKKGKEI